MRKIKISFISIFLIIIFVFGIFTITSNKSISTVEKRVLTTYPKVSVKGLLGGKYYDTLTTAFNDQLFLRNDLVKGYFLFQFQRYLGDVVVGEDNQMFSAVQSKKDRDSYRKSLESVSKSINSIASSVRNEGSSFIFLSIPRKDAVMREYLPSTYSSSYDIYSFGVNTLRDNLSNDVIFIDALDVFNNNSGQFYFKNDHHINVRGGELLYKEIMNNISSSCPSYDVDDLYKVEKNYINGSFNKQIGQSIKPSYEELNLVPKSDFSYIRREDGKISNLSVYGKGNSYEDAFMEGDHAETVIDSKNECLNIMYVGSSFTNILEALTVPSSNRMVSIDYRHNKTGLSIVDYVKKFDIDAVIYIPSQSNDALSVGQMYLHLGLK